MPHCLQWGAPSLFDCETLDSLPFSVDRIFSQAGRRLARVVRGQQGFRLGYVDEGHPVRELANVRAWTKDAGWKDLPGISVLL
jgi:hypothetical protein